MAKRKRITAHALAKHLQDALNESERKRQEMQRKLDAIVNTCDRYTEDTGATLNPRGSLKLIRIIATGEANASGFN